MTTWCCWSVLSPAAGHQQNVLKQLRKYNGFLSTGAEQGFQFGVKEEQSGSGKTWLQLVNLKKKNGKTERQKRNREVFTSVFQNLFNVSHANALQMIDIRED